MAKSKFKYYQTRPKKLTAAFVAKEYAKLLSKLAAAENSPKPDLWLKLYSEWNALGAYISGEASRIGYAYSQDMSDKKLESAEKYLREKISPVMSKPEHKLAQAFINSRHRQAVADKFGQQLIPVIETALKPLDPVNTPLGIKVGNLSTDYEKILAAAKIKINGKIMNLEESRSLSFSDDNKLRQESFYARGNWFLNHRPKLAGIYDKQVSLRHKMGQNIGYKNYVPLAYQIRGRQGYGQTEVEAFRRLVLKYFVPLYSKIAAAQAKAIGQPTLRPWDVFYHPRYSIPLGSVPVGGQLQTAQKLFDKISPILGRHFRYMRSNNLIDLETRPNKQAGAYCTEFQDENIALIFCNSTGDPDDIRVLTHEMGHAFQMWESFPIESIDLQTGTYELAEVYSMGMEFLSLPYMNEFFCEDNAKKFADYKWVDTLFTICYVCLVDEFQHWVYRHPKVTINERDRVWVELQAKYQPFIDYSGLDKYSAVRWYAQRHIFALPFYYIDYALAEVCAMQLGLLAAKDYKQTVNKYLDLCKIGGTMSFLDAVKYGGLSSPFDEPLIKKLAGFIEKEVIA